ncbi:MAG: TRAP transporter permease, partial [Halomonas sp. BM-2019]
MDGTWMQILRVAITAAVGIYLLAAAVQGWFLNGGVNPVQRVLLLAAALSMIAGGWMTDLIGLGLGGLVFAWQASALKTKPTASS